MSETKSAPKAHSEEYFGEYRDFWWNADFLKLMSQRLQLDQVQKVLDVGCGQGHWGQILATRLPVTAQVIGVDREESSLRRATDRARDQGLADRYRYELGDATALPFGDGSFDFVTCQTVLIHLADPKAGLREMLRVLKPGGIILAVEPNNFANQTVASNLTAKLSVDEVMDRLRFILTLERGKKALGLGLNSEGDLIPGYLAELGAENVQVFVSDKSVPLFAPYVSAEQQANVRQMKEWAGREFLGWDRDEMYRYFIAGGGNAERFDDHWLQRLQDARDAVAAIAAGTYHSAGGGITYLISGRKGLVR